MPELGLNDEQVANVLTYVYNQWGNKGGEITPDLAAQVRARMASAAVPGAPST